MSGARMTVAEARKLGLLDGTEMKAAKVRTTRKTARGPYHTRCTTCQEEFTSMASEDRHVNTTQCRRFELVL